MQRFHMINQSGVLFFPAIELLEKLLPVVPDRGMILSKVSHHIKRHLMDSQLCKFLWKSWNAVEITDGLEQTRAYGILILGISQLVGKLCIMIWLYIQAHTTLLQVLMICLIHSEWILLQISRWLMGRICSRHHVWWTKQILEKHCFDTFLFVIGESQQTETKFRQ